MSETKSPPSPRYSLELNDKKIDVKMSFGLLNVLMGAFDSPAELLTLDSKPELIHDLLVELLASRDAHGDILDTPDLFDLDAQEGTNLLNWAMEHVSDFFIKRLDQKSHWIKALQNTPPPLG